MPEVPIYAPPNTPLYSAVRGEKLFCLALDEPLWGITQVVDFHPNFSPSTFQVRLVGL